MKITLSLVLIFVAGVIFARMFPQLPQMVGLP